VIASSNNFKGIKLMMSLAASRISAVVGSVSVVDSVSA
jgi:hypothetical protein